MSRPISMLRLTTQAASKLQQHRSTAHVSPAPDGPTHYRTPEESGMKMDLHTTQALTALLRTANRVDTTETNSLCCAAAGIIVPLSATAEALIPHEKLRGAALADATLNAQKRPLAQPVVGYKTTSHTQNMSEIKELMCIPGVGRKLAGQIHAAGYRLGLSVVQQGELQ
ncbi:hypothetical protein ACXPVS_07420 [Pseudomonas sp. Ma2-10]